MEKTSEVEPEGGADREGPGGPMRLLPRAFLLGSVSGIVAFGPGGPKAGLGALGGALAAGLYVATYLRSHLTGIGDRTKVFDPGIARAAILRMALIALGAWAAYLTGKFVLVSYLLTFALCFLVLLVLEIPGARRAVRQRVPQ